MSSQANAQAFQDADIEPLLAIKRESHHLTVMERFAPDEPPPETTDPLKRMAYQLGTQARRALYSLRKQTVEPVFGILKRVMGWRQMSMRGLDKANGEWNLVTMAYNIKRMHVLRAVWGGPECLLRPPKRPSGVPRYRQERPGRANGARSAG